MATVLVQSARNTQFGLHEVGLDVTFGPLNFGVVEALWRFRAVWPVQTHPQASIEAPNGLITRGGNFVNFLVCDLCLTSAKPHDFVSNFV